jgi:hypothetical protein
MDQDTDPFVFPDMPDEAVVAIDQFLEAFYNHFQNHYFAQMHRWYHAVHQRDPCPGVRSTTRRSDNLQMTAALTPRSRSPMAHHRS